MAKSKKRSPDKPDKPSEAPAQDQDNGGMAEEREQTATAVEAPPEREQRADRGDRADRGERRDRDAGGGGREGGGHDDVSVIDAETNAKYEQVKGGKLFIKDLQTMDVHQLHEIAKQENIQDYVGMKKQDLIFHILRARIKQNGLMY